MSPEALRGGGSEKVCRFAVDCLVLQLGLLSQAVVPPLMRVCPAQLLLQH
jgi:hypothetical protein